MAASSGECSLIAFTQRQLHRVSYQSLGHRLHRRLPRSSVRLTSRNSFGALCKKGRHILNRIKGLLKTQGIMDSIRAPQMP
jgi:hypothetical protein